MNMIESLKSELKKSYGKNLDNFFEYTFKCNNFYKPSFDVKDVVDIVCYTIYHNMFETIGNQVSHTIYVFVHETEFDSIQNAILSQIQSLIIMSKKLGHKEYFKTYSNLNQCNLADRTPLLTFILKEVNRIVYVKLVSSNSDYESDYPRYKNNSNDLIITSGYSKFERKNINIEPKSVVTVLNTDYVPSNLRLKDTNYILSKVPRIFESGMGNFDEQIANLEVKGVDESGLDSTLLAQYKSIGSVENIIELIGKVKDLLSRNEKLLNLVEEQEKVIKSQQEDLFKYQKEIDIKSIDELKVIVSTYKKLYSILYPNIESDIRENKVDNYIVDPERLEFLNE